MKSFDDISPLLAETDPAFDRFLDLSKILSEIPAVLAETDFDPEETDSPLSLKFPDPLTFDNDNSYFDYSSSPSLSLFNTLSTQIAHFNHFSTFSSSVSAPSGYSEPLFFPSDTDIPSCAGSPSSPISYFNHLTSQISQYNQYSSFNPPPASSDRSAYNITDDSPRFLQTHQNRYDSTVSAQNLYNTAQQNYISSNERLEENLKSLLAVAKQIKDVLLKLSSSPHGPIPIDIHGD